MPLRFWLVVLTHCISGAWGAVTLHVKPAVAGALPPWVAAFAAWAADSTDPPRSQDDASHLGATFNAALAHGARTPFQGTDAFRALLQHHVPAAATATAAAAAAAAAA